MSKKNDVFWKIFACLILAWAFLFLWSLSIKVETVNLESGTYSIMHKTNKLTGNIRDYYWVFGTSEWIRLDKNSRGKALEDLRSIEKGYMPIGKAKDVFKDFYDKEEKNKKGGK